MKTHHIDRWPTVDEVRENYLSDEHPTAYALIEGFSDYHPTVVAFGIGGNVHQHLVYAKFYDNMSGFVREFTQQSGIKITWLAIDENIEKL